MSNQELVRTIFRELAAGNRRALLQRTAENCHWTVTGSCSVAGEYRGRKAFYEQVLSVITRRLKTPVHPTVVRVFGEGDWVTLEWRGDALALDGRPYKNVYCWVLRIEERMIQQGIIYHDSALVRDLLERLP
jgi:ketosteroid isomerase-like protein